MANVLPFKVRVRAIRALVDGNSIRAAARLSGADKNVVMALGVTIGLGCMRLHERLVRHVAAHYIEVDETCDDCGGQMIVRRGRRGFFLGCSKYPKCKGTKQPGETTLEKITSVVGA